jgi:disulfide bond formation protein DsbB
MSSLSTSRTASSQQGSLAPALAVTIVVCLAAVSVALVSQHVFGMKPCPWCILQRVIFLVIALVCGAALIVGSRTARRFFSGLAALLGISGVAAAIYQHKVAASMFSCNLTLADKIISAMQLESALPYVFKIEASCADAAVDLLGLPYEYWSGALFALIAVALVVAIVKGRG